MVLSDSEKRRYARQTILKEMGEVGQLRLKQAKVLVIGAGGLGAPCLLYMAAAGVGTLGIADHDKVDLSNLQRQILFETGDVGRPKTEAAQDALADLNPDIKIATHSLRVDENNIAKLIEQYDIVADGSDNIATRFAVHDACYRAKKTLVSAAVLGFEGQISTYKAYAGKTHPCYRCLYPEPPPQDAMPTCAENGILGAVTGIMGALQAGEIVKELLGIGTSLSGFLLRMNLRDAEFKRIVLKPDSKCKFCHA